MEDHQQEPIVVESTTANYFVLYASHDMDGDTIEYPVLVKLGEEGTTTLSENVAALPEERYRVEKHLVADPADVDGDGTDDITELNNLGEMNPVNPARSLEIRYGAVVIPDEVTFETLTYSEVSERPPVKFALVDMDTDRPSVYFQNTNIFPLHTGLLGYLSIDHRRAISGTLIYEPQLLAPDGSLGGYQFGFPRVHQSFSLVERAYTLLAANIPLLEDNLFVRLTNNDLPATQSEMPLFRASRINIVFDEDLYGHTDFLSLNPGEGYGLLRKLDPDQRPHPRDVVIYEALPNELPRVAGIISTAPQTPLSHVNLRALQEGVPNAYIAGVLEDDTISDLIGSHVYYAVTDTGYTIRAATQAEVDAHYASSRPSGAQTPERDLTVTEITPLSDVGFDDWDAFGVKAANVAVLGTLGFPQGTVPDGFAVPFYFYDEFMKHNNLYDDVREMLADTDFQTDYDTKVDELKKLRKKIKKAQTPEWIKTALTAMHTTFPDGQSLRYRSSTNNEDLPGFNGAGLYDSKTQHPGETEEDGISKSLKQVYASLWNFRAFIERDFHNIDHLETAMGVLVHPNYSDEQVNGVAVSVDPAYGTEGTHYVNAQVGEDLVTNPEAHSVPEEVLLYQDGTYDVVALSNKAPPGQLLMTDAQLGQLRQHLSTIHGTFSELYDVGDGQKFAIEIEFKITSDDVLAIKQARPWIFSGSSPAVETTSSGFSGASLTGSFVEAPAKHSGSKFVVGLEFSEGVSIGYQGFRDNALKGTGGRVTNARRVDFRDDRWDIEITPASRIDVLVALPLTLRCTVRGAICTHDGRPLSNRLELTVVGPAPSVPHKPAATVLWSGIVDLQWNDVPGAETYEVQFLREPWSIYPPSGSFNNPWKDLPYGDTAVAFYGSGAIIRNLPLSSVWLRVRAVSFRGASGWSNAYFIWSTGGPDEWTDTPKPVNSVATGTPTIGGTAAIGETLTADVSGISDNNGLDRVKFHYQWTRNDGNDATDIEGATGASHTLTSADSGAAVRVRVSFVDRHGFSESLTSDPVQVAASGVNTPATGAPAISGTLQVGETLTTSILGITDADGLTNPTFVYQWLADGTDITDATNSTYTVTANDEAKSITVQVTFTDDAGHQESLTSAPLDTSRPYGLTATVSGGDVALTWQRPIGQSYVNDYIMYQILRNRPELDEPEPLVHVEYTRSQDTSYTDNNVEPDTLYVYRVKPSDIFGRLRGASEPVQVRTGPNAEVEKNAATGAPAISGTVKVGHALTADVSGIADQDGLDNVSYSYQWLADGTDINDATSSAYLLKAGDKDKNVTVAVSFTDDQGNDESLTSAATTAVTTDPLTASLENETANHNGEDDFTFDLRFSEELELSYVTLRDDAFTVTDGSILNAKRLDQNSITPNIRWQITVRPDGDDDVTITLPATTDCAADGAICTEDNRMLSNRLRLAVKGPSSANSPPTGVPTISGTAQVRETLTADVTGIEDSDGMDNAQFSYQWISNNGTTDSNITNATGSTYTLVAADEGKTLKVRVSFSDDQDNEESLTSAVTATVKPANNPATGQPAISGTAQVGQTLTASTGNIADEDGLDDVSYSYQWLAYDAAISDATAQSLTLTRDQEGDTIKVRVSFTDDEGNVEALTSSATAAVVARPNSPATGMPSIGGTTQVGQTLTASMAGIADADGLDNATFTYQWVANDVDISGATGGSYTLTDSEEGKGIRVRVAFTDDGGNEETLTSLATAAVAAALTAEFLDTPSSHDGNTAFTFELRFSEEPKPDFSYKTLRDHAFTVTGGEVTTARRLETPGNIRWEITITPDGNGDVTVVLPVTSSCDDQGAICTADGRMLSTRVELTVAGPGQ